MLKASICGLAFFALAACASSNLPRGPQAYEMFPPPSGETSISEYQIGPLDVLKITVFQEPDLSLEEVPVDASGDILLPLIGLVEAAGKTGTELSSDIAVRLGERYLIDPQVSIIVSESASQNITVEGAVNQPGIFEIQGQSNLLQAMALAQGPTETARLSEVIVFRRKEDGLYAAQFNLSDIRKGQAANPEIVAGDIVVVGNSFAKALFRDFLQLSPLLATVFVRLDEQR
ncbi:polysaccharide biosynthesis/export family protein [Altererythrobacter ishigakiensis]|uniref:Polysaccharide export outer membrane protein n=1 Tax=Altererythrobacter ishigakiensis TaxID=476157 RepID=A0A562USN4_9SPHN|nr:polysaccharide biosynthesis/export family protein [Altererythrobacter ishigakiensis]TWJ08623.1 polysaccharide export outer membrane protein [Altererythrobacter ishigakiensis]